MEKEEVVKEQKVKIQYGNLDKNAEFPLPQGFNLENDFYLKTWRNQTMEDGTFEPIKSTIRAVVYDADTFDAHFSGYEKGQKTLFEKVTGGSYSFLHKPNI